MTHYEFKGNVYYNGKLLNYTPFEYQDDIPVDLSRSDTFINLIGYIQGKYELSENDMIFLDGDFIYQVGDNEPEKFDAFQEVLPITLCKMAYESDEHWIFIPNEHPETKYFKRYLLKPFTTEKFKEVATGKAQSKRFNMILIFILILIMLVASGKYFANELMSPQEFAQAAKDYQVAQSNIEEFEKMSSQLDEGVIPSEYMENEPADANPIAEPSTNEAGGN